MPRPSRLSSVANRCCHCCSRSGSIIWAQAAGQLDGLTVSVQVTVGKAVETIIAAAAKQHADLIVMATHGYSGFRRWALGSVANEVLRTTDTPLLLVRVEKE